MKKVEISYSNDGDIVIELMVRRVVSNCDYRETLFAVQLFCEDDSLMTAYSDLIVLINKKKMELGTAI